MFYDAGGDLGSLRSNPKCEKCHFSSLSAARHNYTNLFSQRALKETTQRKPHHSYLCSFKVGTSRTRLWIKNHNRYHIGSGGVSLNSQRLSKWQIGMCTDGGVIWRNYKGTLNERLQISIKWFTLFQCNLRLLWWHFLRDAQLQGLQLSRLQLLY